MTEILAFATGVFAHSWKAAILIIAIFALRSLVGKKIPPAWRFGIWLLVVIPLLFQISLPASWSIFNLIPSGSELVDMVSIEPTKQHQVGHLALTGTSIPQFFWLFLFFTVWLIGCTVMSVIFARQIIMCRRWIKQGKPITSQRALLIFEDCCKRMKVKTWLLVAESPAISGPFLVGAIRPTLLLPQGAADTASEEQLRTIFLHELAHLKRWDVWTSWLMSVLLVIHWFNPFLWAAVRRMNADREEACDVMALETLDRQERVVYGRALLDIAEHFLAPRKTPGLVGLAETLEQMSGRIEMVEKTGTWKTRWKVFAGIICLLLAVMITTDAQVKGESARQQSTSIQPTMVCDPSLCFPMNCKPEFCQPELCSPEACLPGTFKSHLRFNDGKKDWNAKHWTCP